MLIFSRPVKFRLTLGDNMKMMGKRFPFYATYEVYMLKYFVEMYILFFVKILTYLL